MSSSVTVTAAAMIITKTGRRIVSETTKRISDTDVFDTTKTNSVAAARPNAFTVEAVTANSGHNPNSCTSAGLFFQRPFSVSCR